MGRIKSNLVKRASRKLIMKNKDKFSANFDENKSAVQEMLPKANKRMRNNISGYIARLIKMKKYD